jgi:acyl dehydratase
MEPLVSDEARALVGTLEAEPVRGTVIGREVMRFCHAAGDDNPIYFDDEAARDAGYERAIAPPTFLQFALLASVPLDRLREDGLVRGGRQRISLKVARTMFGGDSWEYFAPAYHGDEVEAETRLTSIEEKQGKESRFVVMRRATTYRRVAGGEVLAVNTQTAIVR